MIWIRTTMTMLCLEPHELRSIGTEATRDCYTDGTIHNEKAYIVLTLKNGEHHLISVGDEMLTAIEIERRLTSAIYDSANQKDVVTEIDIDQMMREAGDPPFCATRSISGEEAEQILATASSRKKSSRKAIRTNLGQISIENPDDAVISTAAAWFLFDDEEYETGVLSKEAYSILDRARICSKFISENEDDEDAFPFRLGREYFVMIRTKNETFLLLTGERAEDNERIRQLIEDGVLSSGHLIDLCVPKESESFAPRLMSHDAAQKIQRFLYEYGESPILS